MKRTTSRSRHSLTEIASQAAQIERELAAIRRAMRRPLDAEIAKASVTAPQKAVMQALIEAPGMSLKDLSRAVSLAHSTVSGIVDRLEQRGMIERRADETDGRISRMYPSAAVTRFLKENLPALQSGPLNANLPRASADERNRILWALRRLRELLEAP